MRIAFVHTDFRIYWPARLHVLYKYLDNKNIELQVVEIASLGSPYSFAGNDATKPNYWHSLFPDKRMEEIPPSLANKALYKKLDDLQPDIVFAGAIAFPSGAASVRWANKSKKCCVIFDDARLQDVPRSRYVDVVKKAVYSGVDAIFCPAPSWNGTFKYFGFSGEHLFYGLNAVDNLFWQQDEIVTQELTTSTPFIAVGRQIVKKNFITLLQAFKEYCQTDTNSQRLILIGDGPERQRLEQFVLENELNMVEFQPFLSQTQLRNVFRDAGWLVLPSYHGETWGIVVNEAMAAGLPVIVSNRVGCASTLVHEGVNGYTFSPDDVQELVRLFKKAGSIRESERQLMGRKSVEIIAEWGLDRFCSGVYEAIQFVSTSKKRIPDLFGRIMINLWKGRYRPV